MTSTCGTSSMTPIRMAGDTFYFEKGAILIACQDD
jgi:hypothetical protein